MSLFELGVSQLQTLEELDFLAQMTVWRSFNEGGRREESCCMKSLVWTVAEENVPLG